jgi:type II secretory pathway pseudopilin PulG
MYFSEVWYARTYDVENSQGVKPRRKYQGGFTLLELVVIIIILGVLAYFAIPLFFSQSQNAEQASFNYELQSINTANVLYSINQLASGQTITAHNPFDDINISNYAGTFSDVEPANCPPGFWAYQSGDAALNGNWAVLIYRPIATVPSQDAYTWDGVQWIIYTEVTTTSSGNVNGLTLQPYSTVQW